MMAVGGLVVPLADILVNVSFELSAQCVLATGCRRGDVLQLYGFGRYRRRRHHRVRLAGRGAVVGCHDSSGGVGPMMVVPVIQLPVPFSAVGVSTDAALDGHQERANRQ